MTPAWVADAVFYQIFPDRFATSPGVAKPANLEPWDAPPTAYGFKGGDLEGARERLPYLQDLGVTALYFTPIFASAANHRYHTHDYLRVDPILGGDAAFRAFLDEAHARGMKVVLDGVFNHASRGFYQFNHTLENGAASPYVDWFHFDRDTLASGRPLNAYPTSKRQHVGYQAWWGLPALPKLNFGCRAVRDYVLEVAEHWLRAGIDGWRLDVPDEIDADFWPEFRSRVKAINPDAYIVGEIWRDATQWLKGDQFDAVMNYLFAKAALGFAVGERLDQQELKLCGGYNDIKPMTAAQYRARVDDLVVRYPAPIVRAQMNLLGSHDTPRLMTLASGDEASVRLALFLLYTFPGAPCIYYGDEIGLPGGHDPGCRAAFPWDERRWNGSLRGYVKELIAQRRASTALRRGTYASLYAEGGVYVFERRSEDDVFIGGVNTEERPAAVTLDRPEGALRLEIAPRGTYASRL